MSEQTLQQGVTDIDGHPVSIGDVVQINPDYDPRFAGCFLVVEELKPGWNGVQGYVQVPGKEGRAYYRVAGDNFCRIGQAAWIMKEADGEEKS